MPLQDPKSSSSIENSGLVNLDEAEASLGPETLYTEAGLRFHLDVCFACALASLFVQPLPRQHPTHVHDTREDGATASCSRYEPTSACIALRKSSLCSSLRFELDLSSFLRFLVDFPLLGSRFGQTSHRLLFQLPDIENNMPQNTKADLRVFGGDSEHNRQRLRLVRFQVLLSTVFVFSFPGPSYRQLAL